MTLKNQKPGRDRQRCRTSENRDSASTPERILQAAEQLFSERGIDAVSLREITQAADVNIAAVHYHFGSKAAVLDKIFERRARPIAEARLRLLAAVRC